MLFYYSARRTVRIIVRNQRGDKACVSWCCCIVTNYCYCSVLLCPLVCAVVYTSTTVVLATVRTVGGAVVVLLYADDCWCSPGCWLLAVGCTTHSGRHYFFFEKEGGEVYAWWSTVRTVQYSTVQYSRQCIIGVYILAHTTQHDHHQRARSHGRPPPHLVCWLAESNEYQPRVAYCSYIGLLPRKKGGTIHMINARCSTATPILATIDSAPLL